MGSSNLYSKYSSYDSDDQECRSAHSIAMVASSKDIATLAEWRYWSPDARGEQNHSLQVLASLWKSLTPEVHSCYDGAILRYAFLSHL